MDFNRQITFIIWIYIECLPNDLFRNEYPILRHKNCAFAIETRPAPSFDSCHIPVHIVGVPVEHDDGPTQISVAIWKLVSWLLWHDLRSCKTIDSPYWNKILSMKTSYSFFSLLFSVVVQTPFFPRGTHFSVVHNENIPKKSFKQTFIPIEKYIEHSHSLSLTPDTKLKRYVNLKPFEATIDQMAW